MKKITLLFITTCLCYMNGYAQTPFWSDSFEDTGSPSSGTRSAPSAFTTNTSRIFNITNDAGVSIVGAGVVGNSYAYIGADGTKFWAGEDTDNGQTITAANVLKTVTWTINISGKSNIKLKGLFAAGNTVGNAYENGTASSTGVFDYMSMQYRIDGGPLQNLLSFYPLANLASGLFPDNDFDGNGDLATLPLSNIFTEFTGDVNGTGTTLTLYMNMSMTSSAEEVAVDNLRLVEVPLASAPTDIALSATAINENVAAGSTVGVLSSVDLDLGNTFTYTLVSGTGSTDNAAFSISGANLQILASPDFETKSSYSVRIRTADQGGLSFEKAFTINVNNLNEVPTDLALSATAINENVAAGSTVGVLSSVAGPTCRLPQARILKLNPHTQSV
ncbi:cadherin repeat domain-containing protein [Flavobacterium limi]|uniref:cadherin repeat domain-containing protein n=1 Tax=Flavobacterium limi TaxID=2045105 RepID=UPI0013D2D654|nr:cadherin repeat domain-containing protein [Flavobacterium limi]